MNKLNFRIMSCFFSIAALFLIVLILWQNIELNHEMNSSTQEIIMESPAAAEEPIDMHSFW